jgi:hypothetical protein
MNKLTKLYKINPVAKIFRSLHITFTFDGDFLEIVILYCGGVLLGKIVSSVIGPKAQKQVSLGGNTTTSVTNLAEITHQDFTDVSYVRLLCVTETELKFYSIPAPDDIEPK